MKVDIRHMMVKIIEMVRGGKRDRKRGQIGMMIVYRLEYFCEDGDIISESRMMTFIFDIDYEIIRVLYCPIGIREIMDDTELDMVADQNNYIYIEKKEFGIFRDIEEELHNIIWKRILDKGEDFDDNRENEVVNFSVNTPCYIIGDIVNRGGKKYNIRNMVMEI